MKRIRKPGSPVTKEFLEELAVKDGSGCWLWPRAVSKGGYGVLRIGKAPGKLLYLHRLTWTVWNGTIPDSIMVLHRCDVRRCFNPDHLFLGTHADNMKDALNKGRICHGEDHADAILTEKQVLEIRHHYDDGKRICDIAKKLSMKYGTVSCVARRINWKHVH